MKEIMAMIRINKVNATKRALNAAGITSFTATGKVLGRGKGMVDGFEMEGQKVTLKAARDELLVTHERAVGGILIENTGNEDMVIYKFFGPDINVDNIPFIKPYTGPGGK